MAQEKSLGKKGILPEQVDQIRQLAETISYGTLTLVFQDGVLVQIDKNEKIRIPRGGETQSH